MSIKEVSGYKTSDGNIHQRREDALEAEKKIFLRKFFSANPTKYPKYRGDYYDLYSKYRAEDAIDQLLDNYDIIVSGIKKIEESV